MGSAITSITTCLQTGYFKYVVYFYIFTATSNLFLPILNIFMHIPNYFHVYLYLFSCIFIPIFNIFRHIFINLYLFLLIFYIYTYLPRPEYIIKRHIVAINDTKVWHIPTNSNKYKANCSKYSAKSNNYSAKSNKYSAITSITTCLQTGYFNYVAGRPVRGR